MSGGHSLVVVGGLLVVAASAVVKQELLGSWAQQLQLLGSTAQAQSCGAWA